MSKANARILLGLWSNLAMISGSGPLDRGSNPRNPIIESETLYNSLSEST